MKYLYHFPSDRWVKLSHEEKHKLKEKIRNHDPIAFNKTFDDKALDEMIDNFVPSFNSVDLSDFNPDEFTGLTEKEMEANFNLKMTITDMSKHTGIPKHKIQEFIENIKRQPKETPMGKETSLSKDKKRLRLDISDSSSVQTGRSIRETIDSIQRKRFGDSKNSMQSPLELKWNTKRAADITLEEVAFLLLDFQKIARENSSLRHEVVDLENELQNERTR
eukprot:TRINITY_DN5827_c0_g1_i9.p1 TRINITY_DN5827_c0_g1~~TRINITY_DN5827_c0_g1_i9.p1  ORF type:complete len:220 (-),score=49.38 TRINITY_DN5827_c0_g1_i9:130-789(-)